MSSKLFIFDTETTGLPPKRGEHGEWPHIVQLGCMLVSEGIESAMFHCLIKPNGWEIPEEASRIHGISTQMCRETGIPIDEALMVFNTFASMAGVLIAHSYEFDSSVLDKELIRLGWQAELFSDVRQFCTMKAATQIVKARGQNARGSFVKYPKLTETYNFFTGRDMAADGYAAHSAIGDVRACRIVYEHIKQYRVGSV